MKLLISRQLKITVLGAVKVSAEHASMIKKGHLAGVTSHTRSTNARVEEMTLSSS